MKKTIPLCLLFLSGMAHAQTSRVDTAVTVVPIENGREATVISKTITVYYENGRDSGIAHEKTIIMDGADYLSPYELEDRSAIDLITGKETEIARTATRPEGDSSIWKQLMYPWGITQLTTTTVYFVQADSRGRFIGKIEKLPIRKAGVNKAYIAMLCCIAFFMAREIIGLFSDRYKKLTYYPHLALVVVCGFCTFLCVAFYISVLAVTSDDDITRRNAFIVIGPAVWYWTMFAITKLTVRAVASFRKRKKYPQQRAFARIQ